MGSRKRVGPSFFKVILNAEASQLRLPKLFVHRFGEKLKPACKLRVDGRSWRVQLQETDSLVFFAGGWGEFVEENRLCFGDFLVFQLDKSSNFDVTMFDTTCCEKEDNVLSPNVSGVRNSSRRVKREAEEEEAEAEADVSPGIKPRTPKRPRECKGRTRSNTAKRAKTTAEKPRNVKKEEVESEENYTVERDHYFSKLITTNQPFMGIPKDFALDTGIASQKKVVLLDTNGKKWTVDIRRRQDGQMKMINDGWDRFQKASGALPGATCDFHFIPGLRNVLEVNVIKRGRGRPPMNPKA